MFQRLNLFLPAIGYDIEPRALFAEPQLQYLRRIRERITNRRPVLSEAKRNDGFVFAQLPVQIDLLPRFEQSDGIENVFRGWNGGGEPKTSKSKSKGKSKSKSKRADYTHEALNRLTNHLS